MMRYPLPTFADLLAEHMQRAKFTHATLASATGYPLAYCRRLSRSSHDVHSTTINVICDVLSLDPAQRDEMLASAGYLPSDDGILALAYHIECARYQQGDEDTCPGYRRPVIALDREEALPF